MSASHLFVVRLDEERYALHLPAVSRVLRMVEITAIPKPGGPLLGLVNVQGEVLPVVDLRRCLNHPRRPVALEDVLVIAEGGQGRVALPVDRVEGVLEPADHLQLWEAERPRQSEFLEGVVKLADGLVMVCDLARVTSLCGGTAAGSVCPPCAEEETVAGEAEEVVAPSAARRPVTAEEGELDPDQLRIAILRERARKLAREPVSGGDGERLEIVEFALSEERYAVESAFIREVYPLKELTPLPCTPPFVLGIVNLRGTILSVIDLHKFFALPDQGLSDLNQVIVLEGAGMVFGLLADRIVGVRTIAAGDIQPALLTVSDPRSDYLKGVTRERLVVLDGGKMLADGRIVVHEDA
ncbi:chemotaxis protein CheW [Geomonas sp.]|uniref:chemotaxis protein CheW n=1 Tax=Geomonas sp. TaxID=2651584 RepID=UPI002B4A0970|nr:chemotaxis protein CheW [Geomonas sp.]HJV34848.1 chemotaxis protein CheW [Geomonas sp.]